MRRLTRKTPAPEETPPGGGARPAARPRVRSSGSTDELVELLALAELLHAHRRRLPPPPQRRAA